MTITADDFINALSTSNYLTKEQFRENPDDINSLFIQLISSSGQLDALLALFSSEAEQDTFRELMDEAFSHSLKKEETVVNLFKALWDWTTKNTPRVCNRASLAWLMKLAVFDDLRILLSSDPEQADTQFPIVQMILESGDIEVIQRLINKTAENLCEENLDVLNTFAKLDHPTEKIFTKALTTLSKYSDEIDEIVEFFKETGSITIDQHAEASTAFKHTSIGASIHTANNQLNEQEAQVLAEHRKSVRHAASIKREAILSVSRLTVVGSHQGNTDTFRESMRKQTTARQDKTTKLLAYLLIEERTLEELQALSEKIQSAIDTGESLFDRTLFVNELTNNIGEISVATIRLAGVSQTGNPIARLRLEILHGLVEQLPKKDKEKVMAVIGDIFKSPSSTAPLAPTQSVVAKTGSSDGQSPAAIKKPAPRRSTTATTANTQDTVGKKKSSIYDLHSKFHEKTEKYWFRGKEKEQCFQSTHNIIQKSNTGLEDTQKAELYGYASQTLFAQLGKAGENTKLAQAFKKMAADPQNAGSVTYKGKTPTGR